MANEILKRNPTSTGNRRVFTWAGWVKINQPSSTTNTIWYVSSSGNSEFNISIAASGALNVYDYAPFAYQYQYVTSRLLRDFSNWFHLVVAVDTTQFREDDRFKIYVNGVLYNGSYSTETTTGGINYNTRMNTPGEINYIGQNVAGGSAYSANCELTDLFMIDGQALTPDVFGFYKVGKGYISVGSTQATDFRPGQWVPKTPRVIKTAINNNGGFGVNGFYLPMNDSNNFGADFHCDPNSIITLNEKLPQPRVGVASTAVGIGYTDALRADHYAANLVLALPFVSGGLSSGFGDYAPSIKGSGTAKTIVSTSATIANVSAASTSGLYYGSGASFSNSGIGISFASSSDFAFGTGDYTVECWIHRSNASSSSGSNALWSIGTVNTVGALSLFYEDNSFTLRSQGTGDAIYTNDFSLTSSNFSTQQWNHFAVCRKGATVTLYVNGVAAGISTTSSRNVNTNPFIVGSINPSGIYPFFGYIQDLRIYKGVAKYTGGFDVPRPYTPVGIATWRAVPDTTANNFATMNAVNQASGVTLSDGNLTISTSSVNVGVPGTVGISTGKWYFESRILNSNGVPSIGIVPPTWDRGYVGSSGGGVAYHINGIIYSNGSQVQTSLVTCATNDIIGVAMNLDSSSLIFYKNNNQIGNTITGLTGTYLPGIAGQTSSSILMNFGQNPTFSGNTTAGTFTDSNGKGLFKYQPPSGFLALCEDNLPTPAIANPGRHFRTVLYTGDGNSGRSITGIGFTPDLVWIKGRNNATYDQKVWDSVRGPLIQLEPSSTQQEILVSNSVVSFNSDGFSIGSYGAVNLNASPQVAWCWKAGAGTTSTNTNGSITSVVSVNQDAGFSIVSWTGNGVEGATIGHGLNKAPKFIIQKNRDGGSAAWRIWHTYLGDTYGLGGGSIFLTFDTGSATYDSQRITGSTSTTFRTTGISTPYSNGSGIKYITYCWAEIEGYSKFGSYNGNGSTDGPFVYCGFKPAWVMIKSSSSTENWNIFDNVRKSVNDGDQRMLSANTSDIEGTGWPIDFLSNGFKNRYAGATNNSGVTYIFAAYAESPFQTANAK